jgi:fatty acid desaturase
MSDARQSTQRTQQTRRPQPPGARARPASASGSGSRRPALAGLLSREELAALVRPDPVGISLRILVEWSLIVGALALYARVGGPVVWLLAWFVIGTRQHALINLVHEGTHDAFSRHRARNDALFDWTCAAPVLLDTSMHRDGHLPHHRHLGDAARDPKKRVWTNLRGSRALRFVASHLSGLTMLRVALRYAARLRSARDGGLKSAASPALVRYVVRVAIAQGAILALCAAMGVPLAYLHLWIFPLFSLALMLVSLLAVAQHQPLAYARAGREDPGADFPPLTRSAVGSRLERLVFASVGGAYHHEHHLLPGVPHTRLPRLVALLRARGYYEGQPEVLRPSYARVLAELVLPGRPGPDAAAS